MEDGELMVLRQAFEKMRSRLFLGALDCGDCTEFVFAGDGMNPNLITVWPGSKLWPGGKLEIGYVDGPAEYIRG